MENPFLCSSLVSHLAVSVFLCREHGPRGRQRIPAGALGSPGCPCTVALLFWHQSAVAQQLCCALGTPGVWVPLGTAAGTGACGGCGCWVASPALWAALGCPALPEEHGTAQFSALFQRQLSASAGSSVTQCQAQLWALCVGLWGKCPCPVPAHGHSAWRVNCWASSYVLLML